MKNKLKIMMMISLIMLFVSISGFAQTSAADRSWNAFYTKFSNAIKTKNRSAIRAMADKGFGGRCANVSVNEWMKGLDSQKLWGEVIKSINKGTTVSSDRKERIADNYLIFRFINGKWTFYCIMGD